MRILAALAVMYEHLPYLDSSVFSDARMLPVGIFGRMSGVFFVLAGFFACRRISWHKALNNACWSFFPFVLWNLIYAAVDACSGGHLLATRSIAEIFGVTSFVLPALTLPGTLPSDPLNVPLWFMRDLTLLFLLSPLICRWARLLLPMLIMASLMPAFQEYFRHNSSVCLSLYSVALFCFGCFLASYDAEQRQKMMSFCSLYLILIYVVVTAIGVGTGLAVFGLENADQSSKPLIVSLMGFCIFYQLARYLELNIPLIKRGALKFAPVTFLTFAMHVLVYSYVIPESWKHSAWIMAAVPPVLFIILAFIFSVLKPVLAPREWGRFILHLVAHYKVRPDDLTSAGNNTPAENLVRPGLGGDEVLTIQAREG